MGVGELNIRGRQRSGRELQCTKRDDIRGRQRSGRELQRTKRDDIRGRQGSRRQLPVRDDTAAGIVCCDAVFGARTMGMTISRDVLRLP